MEIRKVILLINIGSPKSFKVKPVRKYLREFLMDSRVIQIPWLFRFLLVNGIITTFRAPKSAKKYKEIWTDKGSPLIVHSNNLKNKLQLKLSNKADVYTAMRYGHPSISEVLDNIKNANYNEIIVCPLYPHNAASTTSSSIAKVFSKVNKWENIPNLKIINEFWNNPLYVDAMVQQIKKYFTESINHVVISFHGLPLGQVYKAHKGKSCKELNCTEAIQSANRYCYQAVCYETAKILTTKLKLNETEYSISFQSRLTNNWLSPFTDQVLETLAREGKRNVLVICPSFVADCLETIHEIEIEYAKQFKDNGGETLTLVPALNSEDFWVENLAKILSE